MNKLKTHPLLTYMIWTSVVIFVLVASSYQEPDLRFAVALALVGIAAIFALFENQEINERIMIVVAGAGLIATSMLGEFQFALTFLAAETLLALGLAKETVSLRMTFVLFTAVFIFISSIAGELAPYFWTAFFTTRLLAVPSQDETAHSRTVAFIFGAIAVLVASYSSNFAFAQEAGLALAICAFVNILFGRTIPALAASLLALVAIEPKMFFLAAPISLLSLGGMWAVRASAIFCAITGVLVLLQRLNPETIAAATLASGAAGFCWWISGAKKVNWVAVGGFIVSVGAGIFFNQEWLMSLNVVSVPEELAPVGSFVVCVGLGYWAKKYLPLAFRIKQPSLPAMRVPRLSLPSVPRFEFVKTVFEHQDFATALMLVGTTIALWLVRLSM